MLEAARRLPELVGRRRVLGEELDGSLVTGSWRRLVYVAAACVLDDGHGGLQALQQRVDERA